MSVPRSMTGFGSGDGKVLGGRLRVEIRTVNHRYYNPQFKLPFELAGIEGQLRDRLRQLLDRGHVAVSARWVEAPPSDGAVAVDIGRARQVVAAATELKKKLKLKGEVDLAFVARQPEVLTVQSDGAATAAWNEVEPIVEQAARERSEEHTSELQSQSNLVCRLLLEKKKRHRGELRQRRHR